MKNVWLGGFGIFLGFLFQYFFYSHALGVSLVIFSCFLIFGLLIGMQWYH